MARCFCDIDKESTPGTYYCGRVTWIIGALSCLFIGPFSLLLCCCPLDKHCDDDDDKSNDSNKSNKSTEAAV